MSSKALIDAVAQSQNAGSDDSDSRFDVSSNVFEQFDGPLEDLHWRENSDGILLVGDADRRPDTVVSIRLDGLTLDAEEEDPDAVNWRRARTLSSPGTSTSPQFD